MCNMCAKLKGPKNVQKKRLMIAVRRDKNLNEWSEKLKNFMSHNYKDYYN